MVHSAEHYYVVKSSTGSNTLCFAATVNLTSENPQSLVVYAPMPDIGGDHSGRALVWTLACLRIESLLTLIFFHARVA